MKLLFIALLFFSCAHRQSHVPLKEANKYSYLQEFYKIRDVLKVETKSCKYYMKNQFSKIFLKTKTGKIIKDIKNAANTYTPSIYDWNTKTKINELYLSYAYSYDIVNEHFEISNNIKDCMNDFENMQFIKSTIKSYKKDKIAAKKILKKYFSYIKKSEISPLNVLIAANLIKEMEKFKIITLKDHETFVQNKKSLEGLFSKTGKRSLTNFRKKNYKEVYKLASKLKYQKDQFKAFALSSFTFNQ